MNCDSCGRKGGKYFLDGSGGWEHHTWWNPMIAVMCDMCASDTEYDTPEDYATFLEEQIEFMLLERDTDEDRLTDVRSLLEYVRELESANQEENSWKK